jgi:hypothetical protein
LQATRSTAADRTAAIRGAVFFMGFGQAPSGKP